MMKRILTQTHKKKPWNEMKERKKEGSQRDHKNPDSKQNLEVKREYSKSQKRKKKESHIKWNINIEEAC